MHYPADYAVQELAGTTVSYDVTVKAIRKRVVPALDDELAKDLGAFESLDALRGQVRADLEHEAKHEIERETRADLLRQLASRVTFDVPSSLVDRGDRPAGRGIRAAPRRTADRSDARQYQLGGAGVDGAAYQGSLDAPRLRDDLLPQRTSPCTSACWRVANPHDLVEAQFKAFARAFRDAIAFDPREQGVPSTKGTL